MTEEPVSLGDLAYVCNLYDAMTDFDRSFRKFQLRVNHALDLEDPNHRLALLEWLNAWGCRHLARAYHPDASKELAVWYDAAREQLPGPAIRLMEVDNALLEGFAGVFDHLSSLPAARGDRNGRSFSISFGPTAAAKTLFALRPHVFVAWDELIRRRLVPDGSGLSYVKFLERVRDELGQIAEQCSGHGIDLEDLPRRLGRPESTAAQLIDEYYWITITRKVMPPDPTTLRQWLAWS